jgi:hypothetical protein
MMPGKAITHRYHQDVCQQEGNYTAEDLDHGNVAGRDVPDDKDVQPHGWRDHADLQHLDDEDAEPDKADPFRLQ